MAEKCPHECNCWCHREMAIHTQACCPGACEICGCHINFGKMEEHLEVCHVSEKKE